MHNAVKEARLALEALARRIHELCDSLENATISREAFDREMRNTADRMRSTLLWWEANDDEEPAGR